MNQKIKRLKEELRYLAIMHMPLASPDYRITRLRRLLESVGLTRYKEIASWYRGRLSLRIKKESHNEE